MPTSNNERLLIDTVKRAVELCDEGTDPTEAVMSACKESKLNPDMSRLVSHAYNTGRATLQREDNKDTLSKLGNFQLVDPQRVISGIYPNHVEAPAEVKKAQQVSSDYSVKPRLPTEKAASPWFAPVELAPPIEDRDFMAVKAWQKLAGYRGQLEQKRSAAGILRSDLLAAVGAFASYCKSASVDAWDNLNYQPEQVYGPESKSILKYAMARNNLPAPKQPSRPWEVKKAAANKLLAHAVALGKDYANAQAEYTAKYAEAVAYAYDLGRPYWERHEAIDVLGNPQPNETKEKWASFIGGALGTMMGNMWARSSAGKSTDALVASNESKLSDIDHENEMRSIQARGMLADFLNNDNVIRGFHPSEVINAYNDISKMAPQSSTQPAVMRPLLRKRLSQGAIEPFEAHEMANIEKILTDLKSEPKVLGNPGGFNVGRQY